jgi:hypothetical protein
MTIGMAGTASASCPADVAVITSDAFEDNWTLSTSSQKKDSVRDFLEDEWEQDLGGDYAIDVQPESTVVSAGTPQYATMRERRNDLADAVVSSDLDPFNWDAIIVLDYGPYDGYGQTVGFLGEPKLEGGNIVAAVNCQYEETGNLPLRYERTKSEGIAFHELANTARGDDGKAALLEIRSEAWYGTILADIETNEVAPSDYCAGSGQDRNRTNLAKLSECNIQIIKDHMDSVDFCS